MARPDAPRSGTPGLTAACNRAASAAAHHGPMIYLIVGLDRSTLTRWHQNVRALDAEGAGRVARRRAEADGVDLVVAAVIGTYSSVLELP
jgi:hypothetical protein